MLATPVLTRRSIWLAPACKRAYSRAGRTPRHPRRAFGVTQQEQDRTAGHGKVDNSKDEQAALVRTREGEKVVKKPSLVEQLFPEETKRYEVSQAKQQREVPRLPLVGIPPHRTLPRPPQEDDHTPLTPEALALRREMEAQGPQTTVLVLRNASPNLTEEDFRRLIPQGRHLPGWTLEQGDIIKVIPGRDMSTLKQENYYYLLFSSPLSAFVYQGHVSRIFRLVSTRTPTSIDSPIPPPPGYILEGMDAHSAMQAFTLVPPASKAISLRQLKPPLTPLVDSIVRHRGYPWLEDRPDRMPFEVRLTLEGPQLHSGRIHHIIHRSGIKRCLSWSGSEDVMVSIRKWEPQGSPSGSDRSAKAMSLTNRKASDDEEDAAEASEKERNESTRREPNPVHILGFHTEHAAQSFVAYWHRRPMQLADSDVDGDLPPITNAEILW